MIVPFVSAHFASWPLLILGLLFFSPHETMASSFSSHNKSSPSTSASTPRIVELAAKISSSVVQLQHQLEVKGTPTPSFSEDQPESLPADVADLKNAVLDATAELHELLLDPLMLLFKFAGVCFILLLLLLFLPLPLPHEEKN